MKRCHSDFPQFVEIRFPSICISDISNQICTRMSWGRELWDRWGFAWWLYYLWFCTIMCICPFSLLSNPRVHYCPIPTLHHHHHWHTYGDDLILVTFNRHEAVAEENSKAAAHLGSTYARFFTFTLISLSNDICVIWSRACIPMSRYSSLWFQRNYVLIQSQVRFQNTP